MHNREHTYDAFGNLTNVVQSGSRQRIFSYNAFSQLMSATNPESNTITYTYDNDSNLLTKTSYAENQTDSTPTYATGSVTINGTAECLNGYCKTGTLSITVDGYKVSVNYGNSSDTSSSLASTLASELNNSSSPVTASAASNVIHLTSKATGPTANYPLSASWSGTGKFTASASGSTLTGGANPPTVTATYSYDALNRVTNKTYTDGTPTVTYLYDGQTVSGCTPSVSDSNPVYHRTGMCDGMGNEAWGYDPMGRALTDLRTTSSLPKTTSYTYNMDGSIATLAFPSGRTITYTVGGAGSPLSAVDSANSINYVTNAHYTPAGALAYLQNGSNLYSTSIYNSRLQPCWMYSTTGTALPWNTTLCGTADPGPGNILDLQYNFNLGTGDNGNVVGITNKRTSARTQSFAYDSLNRLYTAETQGTSGSDCFGFQFADDAWANLTSTSILSGYTGCSATTPYAYSITVNGNNQVSTSGFSYDAPGNVMRDGINSYVWNGEGHVTSTAGVTYSYDGDGKRVEKSGGTIYWYGAGGDALDETDLSGSTTNSSFSEYVFFGGKRIARRDSSGNVFYYFADHLGSSREMVQAGQTSPCYDADFLPYGQEVDYTSSCGSHYKFTGKERDSESGLDNFGARYFTSSMGRFMSPDPIQLSNKKLLDPQQWNMYEYARGNPLSFVDPTGKAVELVGDAEQRKRELAALQAAVGKKGGTYLYDNVDKKTGKHYVGIYTNGPSGKGPVFNSINAVTNKLGGIVQDTRVAQISFVNPGTAEGGVVVGSIGTGSPAVTLSSTQGAQTFVTSGPFGELPGQYLSNGEAEAPSDADILIHELGHVDSTWFHGGVDTNGDAVRIEDQTRQIEGEPLRLGHNVPGDVKITGGPY